MMNRKCLLLLSIALLLSTGCTRMPEEYRVRNTMSSANVSDTRMLDAIANAAVGSSIVYTDQITGLSSEINVQSEYFSANGRICRRYTERPEAVVKAYSALSCRGDNGWEKIPVADFSG